MGQTLSQDDQNYLALLFVGLVVPILYVFASALIKQLTGGKRAENWYLGVDLTLASLVAVGLYAMEPQTRLRTKDLSWDSPRTIFLKDHYGLGLALVLNIGFLLISMCIHKDFLENYADIEKPNWKQRWWRIVCHCIFNNFLGVLAFCVGAYFLRS